MTDGRRIGGAYTLLAPISSGAMGAVHRARRDTTGEEVAVKRLLDPRGVVRFEIEARLLAQLRHPRVVRVHELVADADELFLVMDLVDGPSLEVVARSEGGALGVPEAIAYVGQACEALAYVHEQQVVHRDVKPANLILGSDGVVLVDFGIARDLELRGTQTVGIGTPGYVAPEVLAGGGASPRSDVYGLAATLWKLVSGELPAYGADTTPAAIARDTRLEAALRGGLSLDPSRRVPSARAFATALGGPLPDVGVGTPLALSLVSATAPRGLLEAVVRAAAAVLEAAAASIALRQPGSGDLVFEAAWGAGGDTIVGVRLPAGEGLAGAVVATGEPEAIPACREDARFAEEVARGTGYVPHTMMVLPLRRGAEIVGVLELLDRRSGDPYGLDDLERARSLADLAAVAVDVQSWIADAGTVTPEP